MARNFTRASSEFAENAAAVVSGAPLTMACWFRSDDATVGQCLMSLSISGSAYDWYQLLIRGDQAGDPLAMVARTLASGTLFATTSVGYSANTWHHACGVVASTTSRTAYIDGGSSGASTFEVVPTGMDRTTVGRITRDTPGNYMSGRIAEAAIWNVALTDAEILALAKGISPLRIRPANLKFYPPIFGEGSPEPDYSGGGFHLTLTGTAQADHAPVMRPFGGLGGWEGAFTAGGAPPATVRPRSLLTLGVGV